MQEIIILDNITNSPEGQCVNVKITEYLGRGKFCPQGSFWDHARWTTTDDNTILTTIWDKPEPEVYDMYEIETTSKAVDYVLMHHIRDRIHIFRQMAENSEYNLAAQEAITDIASHWEHPETCIYCSDNGKFSPTVRAIHKYQYALMMVIEQPEFPYRLKYPSICWSDRPQIKDTDAYKRLQEIQKLEHQRRIDEILNYVPPEPEEVIEND